MPSACFHEYGWNEESPCQMQQRLILFEKSPRMEGKIG
jgi:hypothetical protein